MTLTPVMRFRIQDEDSVHVLVIPNFDVSVSVFMYQGSNWEGAETLKQERGGLPVKSRKHTLLLPLSMPIL